jgi:hypothetical protein
MIASFDRYDECGEGERQMGDETTVLLSALSSVAPFAPPERVARTLRDALIALLEVPAISATTTPLRGEKRSGRERYAGQPGLEGWLPVRDKIRTELVVRGLNRRELAAELKLAPSTVEAALLPRCRVPNKANGARFRKWLEHRPVAVAPSTSAQEDRGAASQPNGEATETSTKLPAYRLTTEQRERLAGYRELDERAMRKAAGVTLETVDAAIAGGRDLAPAIVAKLALFLEQQAAGG